MKTLQNKGFTLVELIVVITILAILGTIAFISLQGYGAEAKNSKVTSDLGNLVSAIETDRTRNSTKLSDVLGTTAQAGNQVAGTITVGSGTLISALLAVTPTPGYGVANVNFAAINQNGTDFKDPNSTDGEADYIYAYVNGTNSDGDSFGYYQLAGQIVDNEVDQVRINGNYVPMDGGDGLGIISDDGAIPLVNGTGSTLR